MEWHFCVCFLQIEFAGNWDNTPRSSQIASSMSISTRATQIPYYLMIGGGTYINGPSYKKLLTWHRYKREPWPIGWSWNRYNKNISTRREMVCPVVVISRDETSFIKWDYLYWLYRPIDVSIIKKKTRFLKDKNIGVPMHRYWTIGK